MAQRFNHPDQIKSRKAISDGLSDIIEVDDIEEVDDDIVEVEDASPLAGVIGERADRAVTKAIDFATTPIEPLKRAGDVVGDAFAKPAEEAYGKINPRLGAGVGAAVRMGSELLTPDTPLDIALTAADVPLFGILGKLGKAGKVAKAADAASDVGRVAGRVESKVDDLSTPAYLRKTEPELKDAALRRDEAELGGKLRQRKEMEDQYQKGLAREQARKEAQAVADQARKDEAAQLKSAEMEFSQAQKELLDYSEKIPQVRKAEQAIRLGYQQEIAKAEIQLRKSTEARLVPGLDGSPVPMKKAAGEAEKRLRLANQGLSSARAQLENIFKSIESADANVRATLDPVRKQILRLQLSEMKVKLAPMVRQLQDVSIPKLESEAESAKTAFDNISATREGYVQAELKKFVDEANLRQAQDLEENRMIMEQLKGAQADANERLKASAALRKQARTRRGPEDPPTAPPEAPSSPKEPPKAPAGPSALDQAESRMSDQWTPEEKARHAKANEDNLRMQLEELALSDPKGAQEIAKKRGIKINLPNQAPTQAAPAGTPAAFLADPKFAEIKKVAEKIMESRTPRSGDFAELLDDDQRELLGAAGMSPRDFYDEARKWHKPDLSTRFEVMALKKAQEFIDGLGKKISNTRLPHHLKMRLIGKADALRFALEPSSIQRDIPVLTRWIGGQANVIDEIDPTGRLQKAFWEPLTESEILSGKQNDTWVTQFREKAGEVFYDKEASKLLHRYMKGEAGAYGDDIRTLGEWLKEEYARTGADIQNFQREVLGFSERRVLKLRKNYAPEMSEQANLLSMSAGEAGQNSLQPLFEDHSGVAFRNLKQRLKGGDIEDGVQGALNYFRNYHRYKNMYVPAERFRGMVEALSELGRKNAAANLADGINYSTGKAAPSADMAWRDILGPGGKYVANVADFLEKHLFGHVDKTKMGPLRKFSYSPIMQSMEKLRRNSVANMVGANLSVFIKQTGSIPVMTNLTDFPSVAFAMGEALKGETSVYFKRAIESASVQSHGLSELRVPMMRSKIAETAQKANILTETMDRYMSITGHIAAQRYAERVIGMKKWSEISGFAERVANQVNVTYTSSNVPPALQNRVVQFLFPLQRYSTNYFHFLTRTLPGETHLKDRMIRFVATAMVLNGMAIAAEEASGFPVPRPFQIIGDLPFIGRGQFGGGFRQPAPPMGTALKAFTEPSQMAPAMLRDAALLVPSPIGTGQLMNLMRGKPFGGSDKPGKEIRESEEPMLTGAAQAASGPTPEDMMDFLSGFKEEKLRKRFLGK